MYQIYWFPIQNIVSSRDSNNPVNPSLNPWDEFNVCAVQSNIQHQWL